MNERIAVGIDAGGTATAAASSCGGTRAASAREGPANASSAGTTAALATIMRAVSAVTGGRIPSALYVAAAGAGREEIRTSLEGGLRAAYPGARLAVESDVRVALRATLPAGPGIVLIAGTGSVAYAESGDRRARVGGAGYLLGDEGSAYAIGFAALRRLARVFDGREREDETTALAARALDAPDRDALLRALYAKPVDVATIAALAPSVIAFAVKGNRVAMKIVQDAARELGDLVLAAARAAELRDASPAVVLAGGLLRENSVLSFLLETRIAGDLPGANVLRAHAEPVDAALAFAEAL